MGNNLHTYLLTYATVYTDVKGCRKHLGRYGIEHRDSSAKGLISIDDSALLTPPGPLRNPQIARGQLLTYSTFHSLELIEQTDR